MHPTETMIDPIIALAASLVEAEARLLEASSAHYSELVEQISALNERLFNTMPTSAVGAAELLVRVALMLQDPQGICTVRLREIAARLGRGERTLSDLIFLRGLAKEFSQG